MSNKKLFKYLEKEEELIDTNIQFSYFGGEGEKALVLAFSSYIEGYKKTTKLIYEEMKKGSNKDMDTLIYALCFNHRHCMEICLKKLYIKYSGKDEDGLKEFLNANHNLLKIWEYLNPILEENVEKVGSSVQIEDIEGYIKEMDEFDKNSMRMRYPITKKLESSNKEVLRLDFHNFHECMLDFYELIKTIDDDIDNQVSYQATKKEYDDFLKKYSSSKKNIKKYIKIIRQCVKNPEKKQFETIDITKINYEELVNENPSAKELSFLSPDDKKMIEVLYYAGRSINEKNVKLSQLPENKYKDFVNHCIFMMGTLGLKKDKPSFNVFQKMKEDIIKNIETSISILRYSKFRMLLNFLYFYSMRILQTFFIKT